MTVVDLDFMKEIFFGVILIIGIGISNLIQLVLKKREPTKLNIILYSLMVGSMLFLALTVFAAYLEANEIPIFPETISVSMIAISFIMFIFFSAFLVFECVFYKRAKGKKTEEKTQEIT